MSKVEETQLMKTGLKFLAGVCTFALAAPAFAQNAQPTNTGDAAPNPTYSPGDIVVTAQRRAERLQDVGVSVSAIGSDSLRAAGIANAQAISKAIAGVTLDSYSSGGSNATLAIRGVSQSDVSSFQESPNSIYIDDIYLSSPSAAGFALYDLDRVEVLRGPQGTLFGRASSGGLADFLPKHPTKTWDGYAEIGFGSYNDAFAEAAVGGPLSDKVRFRVSGRREVSDGWWHNSLPGGRDTFETNFAGIRGQLEADLTDNFTARLSVGYDRNLKGREGTYRPVPFYLVNGNPAPLPADIDAYGSGPGNDFTGYRDTDKQKQSGAFDNFGYFESTRFSPSLYLTWNLGSATVTSISNYTHFTWHYAENASGDPTPFARDIQNNRLKQFSQELRINGTAGDLIYTAGAYYLNTDQSPNSRIFFPELSGTPNAYDTFNYINQKLSSISGFAQLEYKFTPELKLTVGGRFTHDIKRFNSVAGFFELGSNFGGSGLYNPPLVSYDFSQATVGNLARRVDNLWSGKIQLDYKPSPNVLLYAGVSRGSKGGGFNANSGTTTIEQTPFRSEYLYDYEGGVKLQMLQHRVTLNLSAFNYDYHHFQGFAYKNLIGVVGNYNGYFRGGELELRATPVPSVNINLGVSYLLSKLRNVPSLYPAPNGSIRDEQGVNAPKWTVKGSIAKDFAIGNDKLTLLWSADYIGDRYASIDNNAATFVKGSFVHNARITYHVNSLDVDIAAFVDNISNTARQTYSFDELSAAGSIITAYARPRWFGGSLRKQF